jgi:mRNA-degrading endonuclease YafQ of YafQ-DinJ toxin-antitoxin module
MRALIWSNAFTRSFKRWMRKRPDLDNDIAEALRLLAVNPFVLQLETHKLKGKLTGRAARDTICVLYLIL